MTSPPLESLRTISSAVVYKKDRPAADFVRTETGIALRYRDEYLASQVTPIASTLPLTDEPIVTLGGALPPFFSGLLPEGRRLAALRSAVKTSADDEFTMLLAVGTDTVGDVRILADESVGEPPARVVVTDWSDVSFADVFARETGSEPDRIALPGIQPKASAVMLSVPVATPATSYILKLDPPEFRHLCRNEHLMMRIARRCRLETAQAELRVDREGADGLLVKRFDREPGGERLAVEDACQAAGRYPADKYRLTTDDCCIRLAERCSSPPLAGRELLRWVAFAYATCNGDLHAKNLALAERPSGLVQVAPAYDLPSSYPYGDTTMAMPLNGHDREDIGYADFLALAVRLQVRERALRKTIDDVLAGVGDSLSDLGELPFDQRVITKWRRAIEYRLKRLGPVS